MHSGILPARIHRKVLCRAVYAMIGERNTVNEVNLTQSSNPDAENCIQNLTDAQKVSDIGA